MSDFDEYHELAARLLRKEDFPLPLPNWDRDYPHNIGLLSDAEESGLAAAVLQKNPGMTYEAWMSLSLEERIPWMRLAAGIDIAGKEGSSLTENAVLDSLANRLNDGIDIVEADEVESWPNGLVEKLIAEGVLSLADNAQSVGCDACGLDHVEKVEYIEAPGSTGLRAYITCPDAGRVQVPLSRVRRWIAHRGKLPAPSSPPTPMQIEPAAVASKKNGREKGGVPLRSWTQADLDAAISKYKAQRASTFTDLAAGVRAGRLGAKKTAQNTYGRNAIARALGVRAPAMVSKSPEWQCIAEELGLRKQKAGAGNSRKQRIGIDIALEEQARATGGTAVDAAVRRETIDMVNRAMPVAEAEATVEKLQRGEISDDGARQLVELYADQERDSRLNKVRQDA